MHLRAYFRRLAVLLQRSRLESEMDGEIAAHLELAERENLAAGMTPEDARRSARRSFGGIEQMKEEHREQRAFRSIESVLLDLHFALRAMRRYPMHAALIALTLALGIAGSTAIFSVYDRLFVQPLPFPQADRLVDLDERIPNADSIRISYSNFLAWRGEARSFDAMAVWAESGYNLALGDTAERIQGARVTHDLDDVLGVTPLLGRAILPEENQEHGPNVAVLGYGLWQRRFGGRPGVLGQSIRLNGIPHTIVGVLPNDALFPDQVEVWTPLDASPRHGTGWFLLGIGRLKQGVPIEAAQADLVRIQENLAKARSDDFATTPVVTGLRERYLSGYQTGASLLLAAVGVVLLIACGNAAGLMLVAGTRRRPELLTRLALGASRHRVIRQLVTESVLLSALGGLVGIGLGWWALQGLLAFRPEQLPRWIAFDLDARFLVFCGVLSLLVGLLAGLASAIGATKRSGNLALREAGGRSFSTKRDRRSLHVLVVGQAGLAMALLMIVGLLVQAFQKVYAVDPGFQPSDVLTFTLSLPGADYPDPRQRARFFETLVDRVGFLPGVSAAGAVSLAPLQGYSGTGFIVEDTPPPRPDDERDTRVLTQAVVPGYFEAMGIPLVEGRWFDGSESAPGAQPVVIVNESFAARHFPDSSPIGRRIRYGYREDYWMTIVGVSADVKHFGLEREAPLGAYVPIAQGRSYVTMTLTVKTAVPALSLASAVQRVSRDLDPAIPVHGLMTLQQRLDGTLLIRRAYTWLASAFALLAVALTVAGFYGVTSFLVRRRTHEIGIRIALGEQRGAIQRQVIGHAVALGGIGALVGLSAGVYAFAWLDSLFFGLRPWEPVPLFAASVGILGVVVLASYLPARRAARTNPADLLRSD